jgi:hypothetical protein
MVIISIWITASLMPVSVIAVMFAVIMAVIMAGILAEALMF